MTVAFVDFCAYFDVKKPNINWDNEADVTKNNYIGIILFAVAFALIFGFGYLMVTVSEKNESLLPLLAGVFAALPFGVAAVSDIILRRAAAKLY